MPYMCLSQLSFQPFINAFSWPETLHLPHLLHFQLLLLDNANSLSICKEDPCFQPPWGPHSVTFIIFYSLASTSLARREVRGQPAWLSFNFPGPGTYLAQSSWSWMSICGMNQWVSERPKEQFHTAYACPPSLSVFLFHLPALLHLGKVGEMLNFKKHPRWLQGRCLTPAFLLGSPGLFNPPSSRPREVKGSD